MMLKDDLRNFDPAEQEDKVYWIRDVGLFVQQDRRIKNCKDLDKYC